jgi:dephospho-CoA kinase
MQKYFDKIILVYSDRETQIRRLIKRNNSTIEDAEKRVNSQIPIEEKRKFADFVIDNCGSFEDLEVRARNLFFKLAEY